MENLSNQETSGLTDQEARDHVRYAYFKLQRLGTAMCIVPGTPAMIARVGTLIEPLEKVLSSDKHALIEIYDHMGHLMASGICTDHDAVIAEVKSMAAAN